METSRFCPIMPNNCDYDYDHDDYGSLEPPMTSAEKEMIPKIANKAYSYLVTEEFKVSFIALQCVCLFNPNCEPPTPPPYVTHVTHSTEQHNDLRFVVDYDCPQMMSLGEFVTELRDSNLRTMVIDEVVMFMAIHGWVQLWRTGQKGEIWIGAVDLVVVGGGGIVHTDVGESGDF